MVHLLFGHRILLHLPKKSISSYFVAKMDSFLSQLSFRYLDVLPNSFGTPLWFTEEEMQELKGTNLFNATKIQVNDYSFLITLISVIRI